MNAVETFLDARLASGHGDAPAIVTPVATVTYAHVTAAACRTGNALRALGVEPEQRVAIVLPDGVDWVAAFFGTIRIGAVAVPLNTRLSIDDWIAMIRDSRAKVVVTDGASGSALAARRRDVPWLRAIVTTSPAPDCVMLDSLLAAADRRCAPEPVGMDAMAFWLYTSGTTGTPKAAVHLHRDLLACKHYGDEVLGATAEDRVFATSKLFFAYALGNALLIPFHVGARTYLADAWPDPERVARVMAEFAPTLFFSVPTFYARLLRSDLTPATFASVRRAISAGERLPPEVHRGFRQRFGVEIIDGVGATETIFMVLSNRPGASRAGSAGRPVSGTEVRLLDAEGHEVPDGAEGVLHVRTPSASPFYWNRVEDSRRAFRGEWFRTGDVYVRDADGFYHHCGREDDRFKVAGMWVSPAEVEARLMSHGRVADAGVVGAEDDSGLVKAFAFVVPREACDAAALAAELTDLAAGSLPPHQRPRRVFVVSELPRTATGKLQRFRLREQVR
jgi:benzoate-CoA ligase family protein